MLPRSLFLIGFAPNCPVGFGVIRVASKLFSEVHYLLSNCT